MVAMGVTGPVLTAMCVARKGAAAVKDANYELLGHPGILY